MLKQLAAVALLATTLTGCDNTKPSPEVSTDPICHGSSFCFVTVGDASQTAPKGNLSGDDWDKACKSGCNFSKDGQLSRSF